MDDCCDTDSSLGVRAGEQLHDGRVHSPSADTCYYRGGGRVPSRPQSRVGLRPTAGDTK